MKFSLYFLLISIVCYCTSKSKESPVAFRNLADTTAAFDTGVHQKLTSALHLPPLTKGADSFELRIWSRFAMVSPDAVTIFRYKDPGWSLTSIEYWSGSSGERLKIDSSKKVDTRPRTDFAAIAAYVLGLRLDTMPAQTSVAGFIDNTADGASYIIELATKDFYKTLIYRNPQYFQDENNRKINAFLIYCSEKLGVWKL